MQYSDSTSQRYEVIKHGFCITNQMKKDIINLYHHSLSQREFKSNAEFIRHHLEQKYGRCWCIMITSTYAECDYSFLQSDDLLLELKTLDHRLYAYMVMPQFRGSDAPVIYEKPKQILDYGRSYYDY